VSYREYSPHPALLNHIDAYWTINTGHIGQPKLHRILPDGCTDIIFNRGNTIYRPDHREVLLSEESYLVGTMTTFSETIQSSGNAVLGIRFKPGAITAFYRLDLSEVTDIALPYRDEILRELVYQSTNLIIDLNLYFLKKLPAQPSAIAAVLAEIHSSNGRIKVAELMCRHAMSERKLERLFKTHVGVSIKGMTRLIRFKHALALIQNNAAKQGLSEIAYRTGYYDQAHLCNEIKAYTGITPSQL
jgi:AraC-like DNA-binding protein